MLLDPELRSHLVTLARLIRSTTMFRILLDMELFNYRSNRLTSCPRMLSYPIHSHLISWYNPENLRWHRTGGQECTRNQQSLSQCHLLLGFVWDNHGLPHPPWDSRVCTLSGIQESKAPELSGVQAILSGDNCAVLSFLILHMWKMCIQKLNCFPCISPQEDMSHC